MANIKLKTIVSRQVPEFVKEQNPQFVQFLEAYYEYLDQYERRDIVQLRDVDRTLDEFLSHIKNELDIFGNPEYEYIDKILLIRKIKQLFTAKGSEAAYKFLFKILFDKPVNITYPWDSVLKASAGKWNRDTTLFVQVTLGNPFDLIGERITIVNPLRRLFVFVENIRQVAADVYEIFIEKSYYGEIQIGDKLKYNGVEGTILPTTSGYEIIQPGVGYKVGDLVVGSTIANDRTITQLLKVTRVTPTGGILAFQTIRFGYGYSTSFFLYTTQSSVLRKSRIAIDKGLGESIDADSVVIGTQYIITELGDTDFTEIGATSNTVGIVFTATGVGEGTGKVTLATLPALLQQFNLATDSEIEKYTDYGQIIKPNYWATNPFNDPFDDPDIGPDSFSTSTYVGEFLQQFYTETDNRSQTEDYTLIRFDLGAVAKYPGYYTSNDGFLSDTIYLQDDYFYQKFSYLITIDERLQDYSAIVKSYLHPAGTELFGEYNIINTFKSSLSADIDVDEYISSATFRVINKSITNEFVSADGLGGRIRFEPYDLQTYFAEDYNPENQNTFTG